MLNIYIKCVHLVEKCYRERVYTCAAPNRSIVKQIYLCYVFPDAVNSVRRVQAFDDCVVHAFPGTTIRAANFPLKRQPSLVRNAVFALVHVGTNDLCCRTRSPAIMCQLFELAYSKHPHQRNEVIVTPASH